jgi:hypothetical protein
MSSNEVIALLGPPLRIDQQMLSERWSYYQSGVRGQSTNDTLLAKSGTIQIADIVVSFDRSGTVISQFGLGQDVHGKDRPFIITLMGAPTKIETNIPNTILNYTLGKHSDSHYVRAILMDESGRVISKEAFYYRD